jgi:hypothetical protein
MNIIPDILDIVKSYIHDKDYIKWQIEMKLVRTTILKLLNHDEQLICRPNWLSDEMEEARKQELCITPIYNVLEIYERMQKISHYPDWLLQEVSVSGLPELPNLSYLFNHVYNLSDHITTNKGVYQFVDLNGIPGIIAIQSDNIIVLHQNGSSNWCIQSYNIEESVYYNRPFNHERESVSGLFKIDFSSGQK